VQTFNGYVLSQLYEDVKNGVAAAQTTLINQASDPANWFATITTESIGAVLRQTLMYQSQSYIVLTQLLQTEKMLLAAQTMNNTLLVLSNQSNESFMLRKAVAKMPGG
jgi:membrane-bound inhibitor of C-type lysozyme